MKKGAASAGCRPSSVHVRGESPSRVLATLAILLCAGCVLKKKPPPDAVVQFELFNRGGRAVTGALLRFDRELESADHISEHGFESITLRMTPADTLRLENGKRSVVKR